MQTNVAISHTLPIISMAYDSSGTLVATGSNGVLNMDVPRDTALTALKDKVVT